MNTISYIVEYLMISLMVQGPWLMAQSSWLIAKKGARGLDLRPMADCEPRPGLGPKPRTPDVTMNYEP